jgi:putative salt-induced outer membrane protein YdiY
MAATYARGQSAPGPTLLPPPDSPAGVGLPDEPPQSAPSPAASQAIATPAPSAADQLLPLPNAPNASEDLESTLPSDGGPVAEEPAWFLPTYWFGPAPWDTAIELGLNGSSGTSDSLSVRTGGYIKRESRFSKLDFSAYHNRTSTGGATTQNNANLDVRNDWLIDETSPWTLYGTGNVFYDEFQAFDLQTSANTGVGYRFVHEPSLELMGRFGAGTSREIGGPDDRWVPESLLGIEYSQQLSKTQKFYGKLDYYPEWDEFGEYRLVADTGWEIELVQPSNISLKISASDRFDSTPNGAEPHLVNYSVLLLLKL